LLLHFALKKAGKVAPPPEELAEQVLSRLRSQLPAGSLRSAKFVDKWLKLSLDDSYVLSLSASEAQLSARAGVAARRRVLVDFASPNMAKELHPGHLRSIVQGAALVSLLREQGHEVAGISHVGDFGAPLGLVIQEAEERQEPFLESLKRGVSPADTPLISGADLSRLYVAAKARAKDDADYAREAARHVVELQRGEDNLSRRAWQLIVESSRRSYMPVFRRLGVEVEEKGESYYGPMLPSVMEELRGKGALFSLPLLLTLQGSSSSMKALLLSSPGTRTRLSCAIAKASISTAPPISPPLVIA
jgi:arginyl-tRNA synthetase